MDLPPHFFGIWCVHVGGCIILAAILLGVAQVLQFSPRVACFGCTRSGQHLSGTSILDGGVAQLEDLVRPLLAISGYSVDGSHIIFPIFHLPSRAADFAGFGTSIKSAPRQPNCGRSLTASGQTCSSTMSWTPRISWMTQSFTWFSLLAVAVFHG